MLPEHCSLGREQAPSSPPWEPDHSLIILSSASMLLSKKPFLSPASGLVAHPGVPSLRRVNHCSVRSPLGALHGGPRGPPLCGGTACRGVYPHRGDSWGPGPNEATGVLQWRWGRRGWSPPLPRPQAGPLTLAERRVLSGSRATLHQQGDVRPSSCGSAWGGAGGPAISHTVASAFGRGDNGSESVDSGDDQLP